MIRRRVRVSPSISWALVPTIAMRFVSLQCLIVWKIDLTEDQDFTATPGTKRTISVPNLWRPGMLNRLRKNKDLSGHGTCMASKAAGATFGVAKKANLVFVNMAQFGHNEVLYALLQVEDDIRKKKLRGRAVVNMPFGRKSISQLVVVSPHDR